MKQGLVQDYSQRIEEGYIVRQKLSRLKLYRLIWVWGWGSGAGVGVGGPVKLYTHLLRFVKNDEIYHLSLLFPDAEERNNLSIEKLAMLYRSNTNLFQVVIIHWLWCFLFWPFQCNITEDSRKWLSLNKRIVQYLAIFLSGFQVFLKAIKYFE